MEVPVLRAASAPAQKKPMAIVNTTLHNPPTQHDGADEIIIENAWILFDEGMTVEYRHKFSIGSTLM